MINITDFDSEQAAFDYCRKNKGETLYIPVGEFSVDGLILPHYTDVVGAHQKLSIMKGNIDIPCNQGGTCRNVSIESMHSDRLRDWEFDQVRFFGDTGVTLTGSSYYNQFNMCKMENRIGYSVGLKCNANHITAGRSNCSESHILFSDIAHGWNIQSVFEGTPDGTGNVLLKGEGHVLNACWYERSGSNKWTPATIVLDDTTRECVIIGGSRGYLFNVIDNGSGNVIVPTLRKPNEYR